MPPFSYTNITTGTTTVVKGSSGILHSVTINTTAAATITLYDNASAASGTKIATIAASPVIGSTFLYDCSLINGLTIVTAGASDITVSWK